MEEAEEILVNSLQASGISLPPSFSSLKHLTTDSLVSICAQFLHLIHRSSDDSPPPPPTSLPSTTADRFKICEDLASAITALGYRETLSFHQFLYPSDEHTCKLVRFLLVKLSESSECREGSDNNLNKQHLLHKEITDDIGKETSNHSIERADEAGESQSNQLGACSDNLQSREIKLIDAKNVKVAEVQQLEHDYEILKTAVDMTFDDQHSADYFIRQLNEQVESRRHDIKELGSRWNHLKQTPKERNMTVELSSHFVESGVQDKLRQLKVMEQEIEATMSEINKRELEHSELLAELRKLPDIPPRNSYVQRITEITKNSWKQDADIERILKETRELQLESNLLRERLDRTYMVLDETVFREAKKDAIGRQVYRLLTSIHDSFEQIADKILAADRARREAAEQEAKLTVLSSRSFDMNKLQADLDSIRRENELLEKKLHGD